MNILLSAIIPLIIFYAFDYANKTFLGIVASGIWCAAVVIVGFIKKRKINFIAAISLILSIIGLLDNLFKNPRYYLLSPIINDGIFAVLFFGSLLTPKTLIEAIVEDAMGESNKMKRSRAFPNKRN